MTTSRDERTPGLLIVQPDALCPLHEMHGWLADEGIAVQILRPFEGDAIPERLTADGLVVLGGDMSATDDFTLPWLEDIRRLQRSAADQGLPSLGVCLGGQLMAQAFGGQTGPGEHGLEAGISEIHWLAAASDDPVFAALPTPFATPMMHRDAVSVLPPEATLLGTGRLYRHQAFRVGKTSWAVQFHPEINHSVYDGWMRAVHDDAPVARERLTQGSLDFAQREDEVLKNNRELVRAFASVVHRTPSAPGRRP